MGLLSSLGGGCYSIHPALPWYFTTLYATAYGLPANPAAQQAARAYTRALAWLGVYYHDQSGSGRDPVPELRPEEANLLHALALARQAQDWDDATGCLQGLRALYQRTGRDGEWARLVADVTPDFIDPATDGPLPGREEQWTVITEYRAQLAMAARDWPTATRLQHLNLDRAQEQAADALTLPDGQITPAQRSQIHNLAVTHEYLGHILSSQDDPGCLPCYEKALSLFRQIGARTDEANLALNLGNNYKDLPVLRDLDQAGHWYQQSIDYRADQDRLGQAKGLWGLGNLAYERFTEARAAGAPETVQLEHLNAALDKCQQALSLIPADDAEDLAGLHGQLGILYAEDGDTRQALHHNQQSIQYNETRGYIYGAGQARFNVAVLLESDGRRSDALLYARAALHDYELVGPGAAPAAAHTRDFITFLEQDTG